MWLGYSNKVGVKTLFVTAVFFWFIPFCGSAELVFWYAYKERGCDNYVKRFRAYLPLTFIRVYLKSKIQCRKWAIENRAEEEKRQREYEAFVKEWNANNA